MKNIKDITISIFAVIGFVAIITGFTNQAQQTTPESHVWSFHMDSNSQNTYAFSINKVTGEVRKYNTNYIGTEGKSANENFPVYRVTEEK